MAKITLTDEGSTPETPGSGTVVLYSLDGVLNFLDSTGTSTPAGGAVVTAGPTGSNAIYTGASAVLDAIAAVSALIPGTVPSAVIQVLPGTYSGGLMVPAGVSIVAVGGLGSVQIDGDITFTSTASGYQVLMGTTSANVILSAGGSSSATVFLNNCEINGDNSHPAIHIVDAGWSLDLQECYVQGGSQPALTTDNAVSVNARISSLQTAGYPCLDFHGTLMLFRCDLTGGINVENSAAGTMVDCTITMPGDPAAYAMAIGSSATINLFGSFGIQGIDQSTGTLWEGDGILLASPGVSLGAYTTANLPILGMGVYGVLAYANDTNLLMVNTDGAWVPVGNGGVSSYNSGTTYNAGDIVIATDSGGQYTIWVSQVGSNLGNTPNASSSWWGQGITQYQFDALAMNPYGGASLGTSDNPWNILTTNSIVLGSEGFSSYAGEGPTLLFLPANTNGTPLFNVVSAFVLGTGDFTTTPSGGLFRGPVSFDVTTEEDLSGTDLTIQAGAGQGAGTPGSILLQVSSALGSGGGPQTMATVLSVFPGGVSINGYDLDQVADIYPASDNTGNIGAPGTTWAGVYTNTMVVGDHDGGSGGDPVAGLIRGVNTANGGGNTDLTGPNLSIQSGVGTGAGAGSHIHLVVSQTGSSSNTPQGTTTVLDLNQQGAEFSVGVVAPTIGVDSGHQMTLGASTTESTGSTVATREWIENNLPNALPAQHTSVYNAIANGTVLLGSTADNVVGNPTQPGGPRTMDVSYGEGYQSLGAGPVVLQGTGTDGGSVSETYTLAGVIHAQSTGVDPGYWNFSGGNNLFTVNIDSTLRTVTFVQGVNCADISMVSNLEWLSATQGVIGGLGNAYLEPFTSIPYIVSNSTGLTSLVQVTGTAATIMGWPSTVYTGDPPQTVQGTTGFARINTATPTPSGTGGSSYSVAVGAGFGLPKRNGGGAEVFACSANGVDSTTTQSSPMVSAGVVIPSTSPDGTTFFDFWYTPT